MKITRRQFVKGGAAAFTLTYAAPEILTDVAQAQGGTSRNLVILNLSGGNDSLSMLVPYNDASYYARRPNIAIPASNVLQVGTDTPFGEGKAVLLEDATRARGHDNQPLAKKERLLEWERVIPRRLRGTFLLARTPTDRGIGRDP